MRNTLHPIAFTILNLATVCATLNHVVYTLKGNDAHLPLGKNSTSFKWRNHEGPIAIVTEKEKKIRPGDKFDLIHDNNTLIIKNVSEKDNGIYIGQEGDWELTIIQYNLIVQEPVSEPTLVISQDNSSGVCHTLIKCLADSNYATYVCDLQNCSPTNISDKGVNITVTLTKEDTVECVSFNRVSMKKKSAPISYVCSEKQNAEPSKPSSLLFYWITGAFVLLLLLMITIILAVLYFRKKGEKKKKKEDGEISTVYSTVCTPHTTTEKSVGNNQAATVHDVASKYDDQSNTVYSTVSKMEVSRVAENMSPTTVYDVPSKCVKAPQAACMEMTNETREEVSTRKHATVENETEEERETEDKEMTVYWKLGQKSHHHV